MNDEALRVDCFHGGRVRTYSSIYWSRSLRAKRRGENELTISCFLVSDSDRHCTTVYGNIELPFGESSLGGVLVPC
jgi:hypothetical protein